MQPFSDSPELPVSPDSLESPDSPELSELPDSPDALNSFLAYPLRGGLVFWYIEVSYPDQKFQWIERYVDVSRP